MTQQVLNIEETYDKGIVISQSYHIKIPSNLDNLTFWASHAHLIKKISCDF